MGSLQWSQGLSPPFPFALRRWSPRPSHLRSLQPGKSWLGFRLTSSSTHETRPHTPPREAHGVHPLPGLPLQIRMLSFLGLSGPYPGSLGAGYSRGPATSSRKPRSAPPGPAALPSSHSRVERPAGSLSSALLGPEVLPAASNRAGRRPGPPAAPRPQGNRREPMTDRGPAERGPPSAQLGPRANQLRRPHVGPPGWPVP